jgi:hypothetical protein
MSKLRLTPPKLAFIVGTRAALAAGLGLLASSRLQPRTRRIVGLGLLGVGVATTVPAVRTIMKASHVL